MEVAEKLHDVTTREGLMAFYESAFSEVYRSAARLTRGDGPAAEDLVQEAFVRLTRSARAGDVDKVGVGWMVTTVRRLHIDRLRSDEREARRVWLVSAAVVEARSTEPLAMSGVLDALSPRERAAVVLRYIEDLPVADVAELMDTTVRATESLLQRAKRKAQAAQRIS